MGFLARCSGRAKAPRSPRSPKIVWRTSAPAARSDFRRSAAKLLSVVGRYVEISDDMSGDARQRRRHLGARDQHRDRRRQDEDRRCGPKPRGLTSELNKASWRDWSRPSTPSFQCRRAEKRSAFRRMAGGKRVGGIRCALPPYPEPPDYRRVHSSLTTTSVSIGSRCRRCASKAVTSANRE